MGERRTGDVPFALNLDLTADARQLVLNERNLEANRLRDEAERLDNMTANEYLARGLDRDRLTSFELIGRMASLGYGRVWWSTSDGGWRAYSFHSEHRIDATDVERMLCTTPSGSEGRK